MSNSQFDNAIIISNDWLLTTDFFFSVLKLILSLPFLSSSG